MKSYDDGLQTDVAIPDFSKAFDTVPVTSCSISLTITMLEDPSTDVSNSEEDEGCH
jgi:hypothetical protein